MTPPVEPARPVADLVPQLAPLCGGRVRPGEPLAAHTTYRIGGPADLFAIARSRDELVALIQAARTLGLPWRVLGRGSNLLVSDRGVRGLVVKNLSEEVVFQLDQDPPTVVVDSGVSCARLAAQAAQHGLAGLEFAIAIPGTIGGAVVQNAGAHGSEIKDLLEAVTILTPAGEIQTLPADALALGYRTSRFQREPALILSARLRLRRESPVVIGERLRRIRLRRAETQPREPSCGSVFKNPPGDYAGRLIERAGLKGLRCGQAQVSLRHANFIVNLGGATASEVRRLIRQVQETVARQFGVDLETEVEIIGEWAEEEG